MTSMDENHDLIERLRNIFSLCDDDDDGFISADHFRELAGEHFGAAGSQEITGIINLLDPEGIGLISFDNFCDGIKQILEIQSQVQIHDSSFKKDIEDISYIQTVNGDSSNGDSHLTYSEYDLPSGEDISDKGALTNGDISSIGQIQHGFLHPQNSEDEADSAISGKSSEISRQEVTDEENYEDFGEIESEADISDQGHLTPVTLRKRDQLGRPQKRTQLQRGARDSPNSTRRSSFGSDGLYDHIDENFDDLNGRVKYLESQLTKLCEHQMKTDTKHTNLKKENGHLTEKVHYMEEQLRFMEMKSEELVKEERRKLQDTVAAQIRSKTEHIDYITQRLQKLEVENEQLKEEGPRLREEINRLRSEKQQREELYDSLTEDYRKLEAEYQLQQSVFKKERESTDKLLDELGPSCMN
ncbi:rab11 family-interacting protein 3-like isoform X2 [Gigantopelta aegis]|uniref:rab11 family-interacting protein 3-like isoform X2 n=1 Tax=Gigantopelta aegis TaxID=1735272 RepID=UPI001B88D74B|nr:rab11 family-interacting protein 3-like isoform X2 [Gigantopelta aegis]